MEGEPHPLAGTLRPAGAALLALALAAGCGSSEPSGPDAARLQPSGISSLAPCDDPLFEPVPAPPNLHLFGAEVATDPFESLATVSDGDAGATRTLAVGESLGDVRLLGVSVLDVYGADGPRVEVRAIVCNAGVRQYLSGTGEPEVRP